MRYVAIPLLLLGALLVAPTAAGSSADRAEPALYTSDSARTLLVDDDDIDIRGRVYIDRPRDRYYTYPQPQGQYYYEQPRQQYYYYQQPHGGYYHVYPQPRYYPERRYNFRFDWRGDNDFDRWYGRSYKFDDDDYEIEYDDGKIKIDD